MTSNLGAEAIYPLARQLAEGPEDLMQDPDFRKQLRAAGEHASAAAEGGVRWLAVTQRADGSWEEPQYTGTGFPGDFYINYHLYRLAFPLSALGRYVRALEYRR